MHTLFSVRVLLAHVNPRCVPNGKVLGVDLSPEIIEVAKKQHADVANLSFDVGDAETLDAIPDASFDVVHSSWCLMHLSDPVKALKTWYRIAKPGGIVACRDGKDFTIVSLTPDLPTVRKTWVLHEDWLRWRNSDPNAGLLKEKWAREAGLVDEEGKGKLILTYSEDPHDRAIGPVYGEFLDLLIKEGRTSLEEQAKVKEEWEQWEKTPGRKFVTMASDMLYVKAR